MSELIARLRRLIVDSAPDPEQATPVLTVAEDRPLDEVIPFSSLIVLGTVVAIEDELRIRVTRADVERASREGPTLRRLAAMIDEIRGRTAGEAWGIEHEARSGEGEDLGQHPRRAGESE